MHVVQTAPDYCIDVLGPSSRPRRAVDVTARFEHQVRVDPARVSDYCWRELDPTIDDLLHIAAAVGYADRAVRRTPARAWRREIDLRIGVLAPDFWRQPALVRALEDCLDIVTGDVWRVTFTGGRTLTPVRPQAPLQLAQSRSIVMPFSDGLDSLAVARLTSLRESGSHLILVTTGGKQDVDRAFRERHLQGRRHRVCLPFSFSTAGSNRLSEASYRSRGFVFSVAAGTAAHLLGAGRVIFGESGQGSLEPWLTPVGNEAPDMRMHPMFTTKLTRFLKMAIGSEITFEHPYLWMTKGETLGLLQREGLADDWWETRSCARDQRHVHHGGRRAQCGVCAACLLRRQSLLAAGLEDPRDAYLWQDLRAPNLDGAAAPGGRPARTNDVRQGMCGVLALEDFARAGDQAVGKARLEQAAGPLAQAIGLTRSETAGNIARLVATHEREWSHFLERQGRDSFLTRWAEAVRC